jgi:hypothetical protein
MADVAESGEAGQVAPHPTSTAPTEDTNEPSVQADGNKFQQAISAWRSMFPCQNFNCRLLIRERH